MALTCYKKIIDKLTKVLYTKRRKRRGDLIIMAKEEPIEIQGIVTQALPNVMFKVQTESGHEILAQLSGKMRKYFIKIVPGDSVVVEVSPYDLTKGRIVFRNK